jgi:transcriptional regulator with XRE-family HTH domain
VDITPSNLTAFFEGGSRSRQQLADQLGISQPYLSMIENRKRRIPLTLAVQIRDLTGVPIESLLPAPEQAAS